MPIASTKRKSFYSLLLALILILLFKPTGLGQIGVLNTVFQVGKAASLAVILLLSLRSWRQIKFASLELSLVVFWAAYAIGCYQSNSGYYTVLNYSLTSFAFLVLFKIEAEKGRVRELIKVLWSIFIVFLLLQVASIFIVRQGIVLFPGDYTYMYLFGEDNYSAFMTLPMMALALYGDAVDGSPKRWRHRVTVATYWLVLVSYVYVQSIAASLSFLLLGICYLGRDKPNSFVHLLSPKKIAIAFLVVLALILVFHIQDLFGHLVSTFLDKDIFTLNSRTTIWSQAENLIAARPFFGWGDGLTNSMIWGSHAHNVFLQLLTVSGIVGTLAFFYYVGRAYANAGACLSTSSGSILVGTLAALALLAFFDFYVGISALFCFIAFVSVVPSVLEAEDASFLSKRSGSRAKGLKGSVLILVPHQGDEINIAGQIVPSLLEGGVACHVCFATNGDFREADGPVRAREALCVASYLGIPESNIIFLGYPSYDEGRHLYDCPGKTVRSFGRDRARSCLDALPCWSESRTGEARPLTRASLVADVADVVESLRPDAILCVDFDSHPDHRALSLVFDEAMDGVLRAHAGYSPLVLKKFAYAASWSGPCDYYEFNESVPPTGLPASWPFELENPNYRWDERLRFAPHPGTLTPGRRGNMVYEAFKRYPSQTAWPHYRNVCNSDVVFWARRTDNLFYGADVSASSGDARALSGFRRFEVKSICDQLPGVEFVPLGWVPDADDLRPSLKIELPEPVIVGLVRVWCSPGQIPAGVVRCLNDKGFCAEGVFANNACAVMPFGGSGVTKLLGLDFSGLEGAFSIASVEILACSDDRWRSLRGFSVFLERHGCATPQVGRLAKAKDFFMKLRVALYYRVGM